jgi:hypothetical protein
VPGGRQERKVPRPGWIAAAHLAARRRVTLVPAIDLFGHPVGFGTIGPKRVHARQGDRSGRHVVDNDAIA